MKKNRFFSTNRFATKPAGKASIILLFTFITCFKFLSLNHSLNRKTPLSVFQDGIDFLDQKRFLKQTKRKPRFPPPSPKRKSTILILARKRKHSLRFISLLHSSLSKQPKGRLQKRKNPFFPPNMMKKIEPRKSSSYYNNFINSFTPLSRFFSSFVHTTCLLSVFRHIFSLRGNLPTLFELYSQTVRLQIQTQTTAVTPARTRACHPP